LGFDLYGANGQYFRCGPSTWPRLWAVVELCCSDVLSPEDVDGGKSNSGHFIVPTKAEAIGERLSDLCMTEEPGRREAIEGATAQRADITAQQRILAHLKSRGYQDLRRIPVPNEPDTFILEPVDIDVPADAGQVPFDWSLVQEFAEFCRSSGGFEIR
jgi:hypothetical protein